MNFSTKALTILLCQLIVLEGCYNYYTVTKGGNDVMIPLNENHIVVQLKDGRELDLRPQTYTVVEKPSNLYYAVGYKAVRKDSTYAPFTGEFTAVGRFKAIELFAGQERRIGHAADSIYFALADSTIVRVEPDEYLKVDSVGGIGLWYIGDKKTDLPGEMKGEVVRLDQIVSVQIKQNAPSNTYLVIVLAFVGFALLTAGSDVVKR